MVVRHINHRGRRHLQRRRSRCDDDEITENGENDRLMLRYKKTPRKSPRRKSQPPPTPSSSNDNDNDETTTNEKEQEDEVTDMEITNEKELEEVVEKTTNTNKEEKVEKKENTSPSKKKKRKSSNSDNKMMMMMKDNDDDNNDATKTHPDTVTKPSPTFQAQVHRIRDLQYIPRPIVCMAAYNEQPILSSSLASSTSMSTSSSSSSSASYVAVARENGQVDLLACSLKNYNTTTTTTHKNGDNRNTNDDLPSTSKVTDNDENENKNDDDENKKNEEDDHHHHHHHHEEENHSHRPSTIVYTIGHVAGSSQLVPHVLEWVTATTTTTTSQQEQVVVPTCIASGPDGTLWIINFETSQLTSRIASGGGGVYGLTVLDKNNREGGQGQGGGGLLSSCVAAACHDGSIRIYQVVMGRTITNNNNDDDNDSSSSSPSSFQQRLEWVATLPSAGAPILSVTWTSLSIGTTTTTTQYDTVFFAGVADGTIRRYDVTLQVPKLEEEKDSSNTTTSAAMMIQVSSMKSTLRMTCDSQGRHFTTTKVWCLESWKEEEQDEDGNINNSTLVLVSGNSMGNIQIWNGTTGTLEQSIPQNTVHADVLCLQVSPNKRQLFCSGVDSRVACIERSTTTSNSGDWKVTQAQRPHTHDVKAMVFCQLNGSTTSTTTTTTTTKDTTTTNNNNKSLSSSSSTYLNQVLMTGGLDTKICTYFAQQFSSHRPKVIHPWPTLLTTPIRGIGIRNQRTNNNKTQRIFLMQREEQVDLYRLKSKLKTKDDEDDEDNNNKSSSLLGTISMVNTSTSSTNTTTTTTTSSNLVSSCVSPNGQWVALCNATTVALFELVEPSPQEKEEETSTEGHHRNRRLLLQPRQVQLPRELQSVPLVSLAFLKDDGSNDKSSSTLVAVDAMGRVHILRITSNNNNNEEEGIEEDPQGDGSTSTTTSPPPMMEHFFLKVPSSSSSTTMMMTKESWPQVPIHSICSITETSSSSSSSTMSTTHWMATFRHGSQNAINIYQNNNDTGADGKRTYRHVWTIPSLGSGAAARPTCICFLQAAENEDDDNENDTPTEKKKTSLCLAVATASSAVYVFDVRNQRFHSWSEQRSTTGSGDVVGGGGRNLFVPAPPLPIDPVVNHFNFCREYPVRLIVNPKDPTKLIVGSFGTFCIIDLTKPLPKHCRVFPETHVRRRRHHQPKRKRSNSEADVHPHHTAHSNAALSGGSSEDPNSRNCTICLRYNSMLHLDFLEDGNTNSTTATTTSDSSEMLVVEQPWLDVVATFPEALHRRIYGVN